MRAVDVISRKRDGKELSQEEINFFIQGFNRGEIPDYQAAAWAMAVLLNGMNARETVDLTMAMVNSGEILDLSTVVPIAVDKHSTGGVGDKTTLVVEPIVAACGLPVGKMSGRGLGFSGGTLDKIESIPGYRTNLSKAEFLHQLATIGLVLTGQSIDLAPVDGKLYALRDVTATVQSIPLIASSVMSKKIAAGAQAIVLDVKVGLGAFMESISDARKLADLMVAIGEMSGRRVVAILSNMDQPLGRAVGNALELIEAVDTLHGKGPADFVEHSLVLASHMLVLGKKAKDLAEGRILAENVIESGRAYEFLQKLVIAQGGDVQFIDHPDKLPHARYCIPVTTEKSGWVKRVNARMVGETAVLLGAGREKKGEVIDPSVGITVEVKVGDRIEENHTLFIVHANSEEKLEFAKQRLLESVQLCEQFIDPLPLFFGTISNTDSFV
jgi:pyrimidine-nucleoside phosphorylase